MIDCTALLRTALCSIALIYVVILRFVVVLMCCHAHLLTPICYLLHVICRQRLSSLFSSSFLFFPLFFAFLLFISSLLSSASSHPHMNLTRIYPSPSLLPFTLLAFPPPPRPSPPLPPLSLREQATFDVFLSYRVNSDAHHAEKLYNMLTER